MARQKCLLDSNILIHILRGNENVRHHIEEVGWENCCVSEITVVELFYGAECSANPAVNRALVQGMLETIEIVPFAVCIREFCRQKSRLRRMGTMIEDNDLYIGSTAVTLGIPLATENVKHLSRIEGLKVQNWTENA